MSSQGEVPVVVTGATGYIASHLVLKLLQQGYKVRGTVRNKANSKKVEAFLPVYSDYKNRLELVDADLLDESSWVPVMQGGVQCVYHVASPAMLNDPEDEDEVVKPAVEGTLNVLKACRRAGSVKRVVITSSLAAVIHYDLLDHNPTLTETDWGSTEHGMYQKSKVLAEKVAWEFMDGLPSDEKFELSAVNPGIVVGPVLFSSPSVGVDLINMILEKKTALIPKVQMHLIDVRKVADAHIAAMTIPEAAGHRHILIQHVCHFRDVADVIHDEFQPLGYNIPQCNLASVIIKLAALFDKKAVTMSRVVGREINIDNSRMINVLGIKDENIDRVIIDMCHSMIQHGLSKKTSKYQPPEGAQQ